MRVGVPKCLGYFYLWPLYEAFLTEIGANLVTAPESGAHDLDSLFLCPTDEPCVSVKVAFGRAKSLLERGADVLFVPSLLSLSDKAYCCPKMMGLPAMLRAGLNLEPSKILSPVIDMKDNPKTWQKSWVNAAWALGAKDPSRAGAALEKGLEAWRTSERLAVAEPAFFSAGSKTRNHRTAIMGHSYLIHDVFVNCVVSVSKTYGDIVLPEMVSPEAAASELSTVLDGEKMWNIEGHILGATLWLIRRNLVGRVIFISAFSCGPASIIEGYMMEEAKARGIPFLQLCVDEHTGEAGLKTRLEAFLDLAPKPRRPSLGALAAPQDARPARRSNAVRSALKPGPVGLVGMGDLETPLAALLGEMGAEVAPAPKLNPKIVDLGREISPECMCYPLVTLIGQMRVHAEQGVKRVLMVQGKGRCRLGWYAQVMEGILHRYGYDMRIVAVDSPFPLKTNGPKVVEQVLELVSRFEPLKIGKGLVLAFAKMAALDRGAALLRRYRAYEDARGESEGLHREFVTDIEKAKTRRRVSAAYRQYVRDIARVPTVNCNPLNVALVGEIYVVNEPYVNQGVEAAMASMEHRVHLHKALDVTSWANHHLLRTPKALLEHKKVVDYAAPYLPVAVGGHGQESVGEAILAKKNRFDGVLHLFPFTCMPEIVAQNVLVRVSKDLNIPLISIMLGEQTGTAGLRTRLEAFCDLLHERRKRADANGI